MPKLKLELEAISPLFLHGTDPRGEPEWRAPSVRGQLRYWLRAIEGARQGGRLDRVWEKESAVFGSTGQGSAVMVRTLIRRKEAERQYLLPHRTNERERSPEKAILAGSRLSLSFVTRPGVPLPSTALETVAVWLLLGGAGKRSRRMMGSLSVIKASESAAGNWWDDAATVPALVESARQQLRTVFPADPAPMPVPEFPTLHPKHSWVLIGRETFGSAEDANKALFGLLRSDPFRDNPVFGSVHGGRRASPLIAQVRQVDDELVPVLTAMRSASHGAKPLNWAVMNRFMEVATQSFSAETVWGGPLA
ncbi:MAG: type III-B CRISPR module RAMP protein Cmr1 [Anaerolineae bacterium]|nr:type III-B CRISPR module RAMP protein Cmr1 [Anaerolineae bacterium]